MYKRQEAAGIRRKFWTSFGQYMKPIPSAWNAEVNWLNYHTGIKGIFFRMDANIDFVTCRVELGHKDEAWRLQLFQHFQQLKSLFHLYAGADWSWELEVNEVAVKTISCIRKTMCPANVLNEQDWPAIISFFKQNMIALDAFWAAAKDGFEMMRIN